MSARPLASACASVGPLGRAALFATALAAAIGPQRAEASPGSPSDALAKSTSVSDQPPSLPPPPVDGWGPPQANDETPRPPSAEAPSGQGTAEPNGAPAAEVAPVSPDAEWAPSFGELGITVGLPYFDDDILRPDMNVEVRAGRRIAFVVPQLAVGYRIARLDPNVVPDEVYANQIESPYFSLGARFEAPLSRSFVPFVGIGVDVAWWSVTFDTDKYCQPGNQPEWYPSAWRCYDKDDWELAPVYRAQLGLLIRPEPSLAIELVAEAATIPPADMFTRRVTLLTPSVGMTWHY